MQKRLCNIREMGDYLIEMEHFDWLRATYSKRDVAYGIAPKFQRPNLEPPVSTKINIVYLKIIIQKPLKSLQKARRTLTAPF